MLKRFLSFLLLASMLASIAACGGTTPADTGNSTDSGDTTPADTTEAVISHNIEKCDYNGEAFHILARSSSYNTGYFAEGITGEVLNDAVYRRETLVEEYLGIDITNHIHDGANVLSAVQEDVLSNNGEYDLVLTSPTHGLHGMVTGGLLYNWNDLEYVDLDQPYWNQECNETLAVDGKQFYTYSDFQLGNVFVTYFNKDMIDKYDLENPYDLVRSGVWTYDKVGEMGKVATDDLNGDTVMDLNDQYGVASMISVQTIAMNYSGGVRTCEPNTLELVINSERMVELVETIDQLFNKSGISYVFGEGTPSAERLYVSSGRVLFDFDRTDYLRSRYRDSNVNIGVVPYPKLDANQEEYMTMNWRGLMCIPKTVTNPDMTGKAIELLSYYSAETTIPAFYDMTMGDKYSRDEDMREMLDYAFNHISFDAGVHYFGLTDEMQDLCYTMYGIVAGDSLEWASFYAARETNAKKIIADFLDAVESNY